MVIQLPSSSHFLLEGRWQDHTCPECCIVAGRNHKLCPQQLEGQCCCTNAISDQGNWPHRSLESRISNRWQRKPCSRRPTPVHKQATPSKRRVKVLKQHTTCWVEFQGKVTPNLTTTSTSQILGCKSKSKSHKSNITRLHDRGLCTATSARRNNIHSGLWHNPLKPEILNSLSQ